MEETTDLIPRIRRQTLRIGRKYLDGIISPRLWGILMLCIAPRQVPRQVVVRKVINS